MLAKFVMGLRKLRTRLDEGSAYAYRLAAGTGGWKEAKVLASDGHNWARFGRSVASDGDVAMIGGNRNNAGAVYVFDVADHCLGVEALGPADLTLLLEAWGACPAPGGTCSADFDGDGFVGKLDLVILLANWGQREAPAGATNQRRTR